MRCPFLWANEIGYAVSKKILSCFGVVWWSAVLHEDEIIVCVQKAAFWQQGRLQKVNVRLLVDFSLLRVVENNFCFSIPRHTCTNHQLLRKPISVVIKCLQTLFYDVQYYFAGITANMKAFYVKIHRHIRRCLLITYTLFCWLISPTLLHNAMRKFGTFFRATRYITIVLL